MELTAKCGICGRTYTLGTECTPVYQMFLRDLRHMETEEPRIICQKCIDRLSDMAETNLSEETDAKEPDETMDEEDAKPATDKPVPNPLIMETKTSVYEGSSLRRFLNTDYYRTTLKNVEFYDSGLNEIFNFTKRLDDTIFRINEDDDRIQVILNI